MYHLWSSLTDGGLDECIYVNYDSVPHRSFSMLDKTTAAATESSVRDIGSILVDTKQPLKARFRALFTLRNLGGPVAIDCIAACFTDTSALLKHECAYCMGQMQDDGALGVLTGVLRDQQQEPIVRHEAGL